MIPLRSFQNPLEIPSIFPHVIRLIRAIRTIKETREIRDIRGVKAIRNYGNQVNHVNEGKKCNQSHQNNLCNQGNLNCHESKQSVNLNLLSLLHDFVMNLKTAYYVMFWFDFILNPIVRQSMRVEGGVFNDKAKNTIP